MKKRKGARKKKVEGPATMSRAEYARHRGVSRMAVTKAVQSRRIPLTTDGRIDVVAADAAWRANTDPSKPSSAAAAPDLPPPDVNAGAGGGTSGDQGAISEERLPAAVDYFTARTFREWNAGLKIEQKRLQDARQLLDAEEWYDVAFAAIRSARDLLLSSADRLAPVLVGMTDQERIHQVLTGEADRLLAELSKVVRQPDEELEPEAEAAS